MRTMLESYVRCYCPSSTINGSNGRHTLVILHPYVEIKVQKSKDKGIQKLRKSTCKYIYPGFLEISTDEFY